MRWVKCGQALSTAAGTRAAHWASCCCNTLQSQSPQVHAGALPRAAPRILSHPPHNNADARTTFVATQAEPGSRPPADMPGRPDRHASPSLQALGQVASLQQQLATTQTNAAVVAQATASTARTRRRARRRGGVSCGGVAAAPAVQPQQQEQQQQEVGQSPQQPAVAAMPAAQASGVPSEAATPPRVSGSGCPEIEDAPAAAADKLPSAGQQQQLDSSKKVRHPSAPPPPPRTNDSTGC
jgi:hypothetical protein